MMIVNVGCLLNIHLFHFPYKKKRGEEKRKEKEEEGKEEESEKEKKERRKKKGRKELLFQCQCIQLNAFIVQPPF